jgi:hypothetical protein
MNKDQNLNTIKECFDMILSGDKEDSRLAARKVGKLLHSAQSGRNKYDDIKDIVNSAPGNYAIISEDWRQENFVAAVSVIYFLHDRGKEPDFLFPWFFRLLQHPRGNIRYAAVRMIANETGPLTYHLRFPGEELEELKPERADRILRALYISLNELSAASWEPKYKRYKYIDSLPAGPYKSVQMVLAELEDLCGREYMERFIID